MNKVFIKVILIVVICVGVTYVFFSTELLFDREIDYYKGDYKECIAPRLKDTLKCSLETNLYDNLLYFKVTMKANSEVAFDSIQSEILRWYPKSFGRFAINFLDKHDFTIFRQEVDIGSLPISSFWKITDSGDEMTGEGIESVFECSKELYSRIADWEFDFPLSIHMLPPLEFPDKEED